RLESLSGEAQKLPPAALVRGWKCQRQGQWEQAGAEYTSAAASDQSSLAFLAAERLGMVCARAGRYEEALAALEKAESQGDNSATRLLYYGWCCYELGYYAECVEKWTRLHQQFPEWRWI